MPDQSYKILLDLRWGGYTGTDIDEIMADKPPDRSVRCELETYPTCEGLNSYRIYVEALGLVVLSHLSKAFFEELGKEMYRWCKGGLGAVFKRKKSADGWAEFKFLDKRILLDDFPGDDTFADCWLALPELITTTDLSGSDTWIITYDQNLKKAILQPTRWCQ